MNKKNLLDAIEVKSPCEKDWHQMYGNDRVRFCEHCVKHVHDLSAMTRKEAERFVRRAEGSICIRYTRNPDGRIQTTGDKLYQISLRASRLAAGVFGATLAVAAPVFAQGGSGAPQILEKKNISSNEGAEKTSGSGAGSGSVYGDVLDSAGAVIPGTTVTLFNIKAETSRAVISDEKGSYIFGNVTEGNYRVVFEIQGFKKLIIENITLASGENTRNDAVLSVGEISVTVGGAMIVYYENELIRAVNEHDLKQVKQLIARGANVNEKEESDGMAALHVAAENLDIEMIKLLFAAGAKANIRDEDGYTALMFLGDDYDPDDEEETEDGIEEIGGAGNLDEDSSESADLIETRFPTVSNTGENETADDEEITEESQQAEEDEAERLRLEKETRAYTEALNLLIAHGAKVNMRDDKGNTALMFAAQKENPALLRLLIANGAGVNVQAKSGRTALMDASDEGELENVRILLEAGAKVDLKDDEGDTAYSLASNDDIEKLLVQYGAKPYDPVL